MRIDKSKTKKNGAHTQLYRNSLARESFPSVYVFFFFSLHFIMDFNTDSLQVIALFSDKQLLRTNDSQLKIIAKTKHFLSKTKNLAYSIDFATFVLRIYENNTNNNNNKCKIKPIKSYWRYQASWYFYTLFLFINLSSISDSDMFIQVTAFYLFKWDKKKKKNADDDNDNASQRCRINHKYKYRF